MSIQGHVNAIKRHQDKAKNAGDSYEREKELKFARIAYQRLCGECDRKTEKQVMRDSSEGYNFWKNGVPGLDKERTTLEREPKTRWERESFIDRSEEPVIERERPGRSRR